jgi:hypothetical protein
MWSSYAPDRQIIESLRAGVPTLGAVNALGSAQSDIEDTFTDLLGRVAGNAESGLVIGGGFGSGKSHLLRHLGLLAGREGFVVSHVVVSKECPLHDAAKVAWMALDTAVLPDTTGPAIENIATMLDPASPGFAELMMAASSPSSGLDARFAATLLLYRKLKLGQGDFYQSIVRFWTGETLSMAELRRQLTASGEPLTVGRIPPTQLARQRLSFAARLMAAAGYKGWIIFFDEVELVARYSLLSRAKSYAEVGRWCVTGHELPGAPIGAVFALTDDFPAAVLDGRNERTNLPARIRARQTPEAEELTRAASLGMDVIDRQMHLLAPLEDSELRIAYQRIKASHAAAFNWSPPDVSGLTRSTSNRMRQYVRAWINEWDLIRLDPSYRPRTHAERLSSGVLTVPDRND